jgi:uroporphyrinogen decarboxylase
MENHLQPPTSQASMSSRQRVLTTLAHREPDRVPYDLGGIGPTSISLGAYAKVLQYLSVDEPAKLGDISSQRAEPSEAMLQKIGVDTRPLRYGAQRSWSFKIEERDGYSFYFDEWGIGRKMPLVNGHNYFIFSHPLAAVETSDLPRYSWPDPLDPKRLEGLERQAGALRAEADPALVFGGSFSQGLLQFGAQLEGYERFFMNLALEPRRVEWLLDKLLELKLQFYLNALEKLKGWVDVVAENDDLGTQQSQWISPQMFRKFVKPRYAELFRTLKKRFGVKILFHSCGAVYPFLPDLIEMGADILNPIQLSAQGMGDTAKLKREFGDSLSFWGGGVDVQQTLPRATPDEIEEEVQRRIEDLAPGGGFIFTPTQTIQPDTPPENVAAMWRALRRYGIYPLGPKR